MAIFDSWETVPVSVNRYKALPNRIRLCKYDKPTANGPKSYRRFLVSKNLLDESGADRFVLKTKGDTFALVPDPNGPIYHTGNRLLGVSSTVIDVIAEKIQVDECQASCIDGAIVFPIRDNFIIG